LCFVSQELEK